MSFSSRVALPLAPCGLDISGERAIDSPSREPERAIQFPLPRERMSLSSASILSIRSKDRSGRNLFFPYGSESWNGNANSPISYSLAR